LRDVQRQPITDRAGFKEAAGCRRLLGTPQRRRASFAFRVSRQNAAVPDSAHGEMLTSRPRHVGLTSGIAFYIICSITMARSLRQHELPFRAWGGRRVGAGRKPSGQTPGLPHRARPIHDRRHPIHVTMRAVCGPPSLRTRNVFPAVRRGLAAASRAEFRIVHFNVQSNHVHMLVEAEGTRALGRGMQGLATDSRRRSIAHSGVPAGFGRIGITAARCARRARPGTVSSTFCSTAGSIT
jgi:hypothetical protein